jgi:hypothetical protein
VVADQLARASLGAIDWAAPWFAAVAPRGSAALAAGDWRAALNAAARAQDLRTASGAPVRFAAPDAAGDAAYEAHIARTGEVPTRANRHDFLNALVWLAFPRIKARLNALQAAALAAAGAGARRGPLRDAATLLDENGVLLATPRADLVDALRRHDWRALFVEHRAAWGTAIRPLAIGHALMDKLVTPYKAVTAHALALPVPADAPAAEIDAAAAAALDAGLTPRALLPLPVLGIPGWSDNACPAFYDDATVFRPARRAA